jgi:DNA-binding NtrC family response regulator
MTVESPARILVIDDESNICRNCQRILQKSNYAVDYTLDGGEALEMLSRQRYEVVITDIRMGRIGGMEILQWIRENAPDTKVVGITGYASISSAVEIMKAGAFDYLPKPFTPEHRCRGAGGPAPLQAEQRAPDEERDRPAPDPSAHRQQLRDPKSGGDDPESG